MTFAANHPGIRILREFMRMRSFGISFYIWFVVPIRIKFQIDLCNTLVIFVDAESGNLDCIIILSMGTEIYRRFGIGIHWDFYSFIIGLLKKNFVTINSVRLLIMGTQMVWNTTESFVE